MSHHQVLIIGGGNAGISVAAQLKRKRSSLNITIVDPAEVHYYQPAWTLVGGGAFDVQKTVRRERDLIPSGINFIQEACATFEPDQNQVTLASGKTLTYDYLIVCPGIQLDWHKIPGLVDAIQNNQGVSSNYTFEWAPKTWDLIRNFKGGVALFTAPSTPIKCGGAPQKIMYLAADHFRKEGLLKKGTVHFYSGGTIIFAVKVFADTLNEVVKRYGIETHFGHNLVEVRGADRVAVFEAKTPDADQHKHELQQTGCVVLNTSAVGDMVRYEVQYDIMHATPPQSAPDFIKNSPLAVPNSPFGWIDVNKNTLQHVRYANIFGLGDATSTPNAKTGAAIRKQAPVLVTNLLEVMDGRPLDGNYNGYGSCPLITGYGKLVLAEFDYDNQPQMSFPFDQAKERYSMWLLKREVLPRMYWNAILKGLA